MALGSPPLFLSPIVGKCLLESVRGPGMGAEGFLISPLTIRDPLRRKGHCSVISPSPEVWSGVSETVEVLCVGSEQCLYWVKEHRGK